MPTSVSVLPALNSNFAHHIAAGLDDGTVVTGQNNISHPSEPTTYQPEGLDPAFSPPAPHNAVEDANLPGTLPTLRRPALAFSKRDEEALPARIARLWYINPYGQEIHLAANPRVLDALRRASCIIYSIGSLFTSIIPSLVLLGVGERISSARIRAKVLLLNGTLDRETGPPRDAFTAVDFVAAIARACAESRGRPPPRESEYAAYVTHVVHMAGPPGPVVDRARLQGMGIETLRVYGPGGRYDGMALQQALEAIIGRRGGDRTRRNTLVG